MKHVKRTKWFLFEPFTCNHVHQLRENIKIIEIIGMIYCFLGASFHGNILLLQPYEFEIASSYRL